MPIEFRKQDERQAVVHCRGDIAIYTFGPDENTHGVAWLLMQEGEAGEPGRRVPPEMMGARDLSEQEGVFIAADDVRSLDSIIEALTDLRDALFMAQTSSAFRKTHCAKEVTITVPGAEPATVELNGTESREEIDDLLTRTVIGSLDAEPSPEHKRAEAQLEKARAIAAQLGDDGRFLLGLIGEREATLVAWERIEGICRGRVKPGSCGCDDCQRPIEPKV